MLYRWGFSLIATIIEYSAIYLLIKPNKSRSQTVLFIAVTLPLLVSLNQAGIVGKYCSLVLEMLAFYFFYRTKPRNYALLGRLVLANCLTFIAVLASDILWRYYSANYFALGHLAVEALCGAIFVYIGVHLKVDSELDSETGKPFFLLICYMGLALNSFLFIRDVSQSKFVTGILFGFTVIQLIFVGIIYSLIKQYQHKKDLEEQRRDLEAYMRELELNQRKLRKFKHDYQNMLLSLEESIRAGKSAQALQQLAKYSQKNFTDKLLWRFNDVDNIKDLQLKSIFINKLNILFSYDIKVDFECRQEIKTPAHLDTFDLVRIIGIVLDNAIEESRLLGASAHVQMALYQTEGVLEIMLKNRCRHEKVELAQIENAGYSTKAGHYGVGLTTVREIVSDYNNIFIEYTSAKHEFTFEMKVVLEER